MSIYDLMMSRENLLEVEEEDCLNEQIIPFPSTSTSASSSASASSSSNSKIIQSILSKADAGSSGSGSGSGSCTNSYSSPTATTTRDFICQQPVSLGLSNQHQQDSFQSLNESYLNYLNFQNYLRTLQRQQRQNSSNSNSQSDSDNPDQNELELNEPLISAPTPSPSQSPYAYRPRHSFSIEASRPSGVKSQKQERFERFQGVSSSSHFLKEAIRNHKSNWQNLKNKNTQNQSQQNQSGQKEKVPVSDQVAVLCSSICSCFLYSLAECFLG